MEELDQIVEAAPTQIGAASPLDELEAVEADLVGRHSKLAELQRGIGKLSNEEKPVVGRAIQEARSAIVPQIESRRAELERKAADLLLADDRVDMTLEAYRLPAGSLHLIQQTIDEITDIFTALGYAVADGPEAEL